MVLLLHVWVSILIRASKQDDQPDVYETPDADSANQVTSFGDQVCDIGW